MLKYLNKQNFPQIFPKFSVHLYNVYGLSVDAQLLQQTILKVYPNNEILFAPAIVFELYKCISLQVLVNYWRRNFEQKQERFETCPIFS